MTAGGGESSIEAMARRIRAGDRATLARAITLVESRRGDHQARARALAQILAPGVGTAMRVGITGVPGVGKSTLIETLGSNLTRAGHKVAVLAVDPSSKSSGGSILGDKTRMARLAADPNAFIRPSPAGGTLGGVASRTRETMALCEAAGFDVLLVETVGVGQSETAVADMTDFFLVLTLPGAGDELQGIKKGIIEQADMVAVNKADLDPARARQAAAEYGAALRILAPASPDWAPPVVLISGLANHGLDEMWGAIERHRAALGASGELERKRARQQVEWMWALLEERLLRRVLDSEAVKGRLARLEREVAGGALTPEAAVEQILAAAQSH
ncbi:MAG: methylmalonyl Co-A mutase-associated GTPase MeaB [Roseiarcus sp.]